MTPDVGTLDKLGLRGSLDADEAQCMRANWEHWQTNAERYGDHPAASWADEYAVELEIANLLKHLAPGGRLLDAGCANGYTTFRALASRPDQVYAFDYSPAMVEQAKSTQAKRDPQGTITFARGNVLAIDQLDGTFDQAYTVRVLINLPSWEAQRQAIRQVHRVLKPGGKYILSEAFAGSQARLNALRRTAGLRPLKAPPFNLYLEEERLEGFLPGRFEITAVERFSSLYYAASRFLRELAVEPDTPPTYDHPVNALAARLTPGSRGGDFGVQKAYILTRT